jgi:hypothetical protein
MRWPSISCPGSRTAERTIGLPPAWNPHGISCDNLRFFGRSLGPGPGLIFGLTGIPCGQPMDRFRLPLWAHIRPVAAVSARLVATALSGHTGTAYFRRMDMRLEEHFESSSTLQRNERVKLAASFWNNVGAGMVLGGMAAAFFLDKPPGTWIKIGIAIAGFVLGWLCYSIASNLLTYLHTAPEVRH